MLLKALQLINEEGMIEYYHFSTSSKKRDIVPWVGNIITNILTNMLKVYPGPDQIPLC